MKDTADPEEPAVAPDDAEEQALFDFLMNEDKLRAISKYLYWKKRLPKVRKPAEVSEEDVERYLKLRELVPQCEYAPEVVHAAFALRKAWRRIKPTSRELFGFFVTGLICFVATVLATLVILTLTGQG